MPTGQQLPWRGPGPGRPSLPLPPEPMPLWRDGGLRKRWRYVAAFDERLMLCAARVQVGPFPQAFWAIWDRRDGRRLDHTSFRPGGREVTMSGPEVRIRARQVRAALRFGHSEPIEAICPSGRGWGWTRKLAGMPVSGLVEAGGRDLRLDGRGVDDDSAGYHRRDTSWHWSAGVGRAVDGRLLAWNLVEGINDPPRDSERAVWIDEVPTEPPPVSFDGLDAIRFAGGASMRFQAECERKRSDNFLVLRSRYALRFGTFSGSLDGIEIADGLGVMEAHEARW